MIIGGAIAHNTAAWVSGLVLLIIDIFVGIILQYRVDKAQGDSDSGEANVNIFQYIHKLEKIQKKPGATAFFTPAEIISGLVNLSEAKQKLSEFEYFYILVVYKVYKRMCLDYFGFLGLCFDLIAHFDMVAPFYQYCGNDALQLEKSLEDEKSSYRAKAKKLLEEKLIFSKQWMELHEEFLKKFYA